jgi:predicted nucleotide-binding protein
MKVDVESLLHDLIDEVQALAPGDLASAEAVKTRALMILGNAFPPGRPWAAHLSNVRFDPRPFPYESRSRAELFEVARGRFLVVLRTALEEWQLFGNVQEAAKSSGLEEPSTPLSNRVFVVHGHDDEMKQAVARTLERLGLESVVLHEFPDKGRTIVEKFTDHAEVSFAVVLLSPDDMGCERSGFPDQARPRGRQNVILELGFFLGRIGRARVAVLHREEPQFEMPTDYSGVLFIPFDSPGKWQFRLVQELGAAGFAVDANHLLRNT